MKPKPQNSSVIQTPKKTPLVVNWHITEVCNYRCRHCYAKWNDQVKNKELIHQIPLSMLLIDNIYNFFSPDAKHNALYRKMPWSSLRLNIAGGEPTLYKEKLLYILTYAKSLGIDVSIITNGSQFHDLDFVRELSSLISILGISIDSSHHQNNSTIGRKTRKHEQLTLSVLRQALYIAKTTNPSLKIKINSVINQLNYQEDMNPLINLIMPHRWKVLRMLPIVTDELAISDEQFQHFIVNHQEQLGIMTVEDNQDMTDSYIMIDPHGRFFQNSGSTTNSPYTYSQEINRVGAAAAFNSINFDLSKFQSRY